MLRRSAPMQIGRLASLLGIPFLTSSHWRASRLVFLSSFVVIFFSLSLKNVFPVQEFVYLFAPLRHLLKEADLQNFRLENGLKIWPALWDYRHPNALCFTAPIRPKKGYHQRCKTTGQQQQQQQNSSSPPNYQSPPSLASIPVASSSKEPIIFNDVFSGIFTNIYRKIQIIYNICLLNRIYR